MRLWHKDFIPDLTKEQLLGLWRELSAIAGSIQKKGTPNHLLVNFVLEYDYNHFISYAAEVREEMTRRGYRTMEKVWKKITSLKPEWERLPHNEIYKEKMDEVYLTICYYNLYEKYLCNGIKDFDFKKIMYLYIKEINEG